MIYDKELYHYLILHFPIAMFIIGYVFEVLSILFKNDLLSKLIETSISKDKPIIVSNKNSQIIGVITQSDLLRAVVEGYVVE